ncbi:NGG1p interacting factor NIF3 [Candidatus Curtissbacteria bacterium RIFCSPLOWO2_01_FULL_37_9]|uniref:NGG1p interacting factor NIF3 n=1 Tax=Candidatus Curtissbacteria bacterium RIFCSPLOWO2_01_FULL_37_9 TaxID=1797724 RepID=A0A1F5GS65_9BACT|nr:MAG: NGG1p interacting factor NIF3 [Candidatus Curtissbacteria bacterium RIFCSPLOWO2_01_FULL_37_9]
MTIQEIYELAIKLGTEADPRGKEGVKKYLARQKKTYEELPAKKKEDFDLESLRNPYSDTRVLFGDLKKPVKKVMAGIDFDAGEVVLADRLNEKGENIDLLIAHHPAGGALSSLHEVMDIQVDLMASYGVPVNVAEGVLADRISEVRRKIGPANHYRSVDAARLLGMPFMCIHTVWDNMGWRFMADIFEKKDHETVGDVLDILRSIPEYKQAIKFKAGPSLYTGNERNRAGRVAVAEFTGGTEGAKEIYEKLSQAGVGTIISMHTSEEHREEAKKYHINLIIAGHMVSDSIGANLFLDELEKRGIIVIPASGLIRVKRLNKTKK